MRCCTELSTVHEENDQVLWKFEKNNNFSQSNPYTNNALTILQNNLERENPLLSEDFYAWGSWKMGSYILTKDNQVRRKWKGDPSCYFCEDNITISHLDLFLSSHG